MTSDEWFDEIAARLAPQGVVAGKVFGKRALKADSKAFACLKGDLLAFRLGAGSPEHTAALAVPGAELFLPADNDRPFKDWVAVPVAAADSWPRWADAALAALHG
ncbi:hypothetical protein [Nocardia stercoris]|uniref:TfoX N-terminal domain-containing protein n=1 Tax=Nocardia stercoris TaxID=2483361 RepID=A0A3M2KTW3_9NOCA|nr:hypothetical protein [Nocardia stercoris]RMI29082.1 hypothetical protein EBN03_26965 [Nocardia stercoris]